MGKITVCYGCNERYPACQDHCERRLAEKAIEDAEKLHVAKLRKTDVDAEWARIDGERRRSSKNLRKRCNLKRSTK